MNAQPKCPECGSILTLAEQELDECWNCELKEVLEEKNDKNS